MARRELVTNRGNAVTQSRLEILDARPEVVVDLQGARDPKLISQVIADHV